MNRKILSTVLVLLIAALSVSPCFASTKNTSFLETIYYNDGSYAVITTTVQTSSIANQMSKADSNLAKSSSSAKSASKTYDYYDKYYKKVWTFTTEGTFTYNGTTAKAIRSSCSASANSGWKCTKKTSKCSGATVTGNATFRLDGVSKKATVKLTCSANGSIS